MPFSAVTIKYTYEPYSSYQIIQFLKHSQQQIKRRTTEEPRLISLESQIKTGLYTKADVVKMNSRTIHHYHKNQSLITHFLSAFRTFLIIFLLKYLFKTSNFLPHLQFTILYRLEIDCNYYMTNKQEHYGWRNVE